MVSIRRYRSKSVVIILDQRHGVLLLAASSSDHLIAVDRISRAAGFAGLFLLSRLLLGFMRALKPARRGWQNRDR